MRELTAHEMRCRIAARFGSTTTDPQRPAHGVPEYLVLFEVALDGRQSRTRLTTGKQRIDAVAYGMWSKTDHVVHGVEIKIGRADLLRELRDPTKAEASIAACDYWWLALSHPGLLRDDDLVPDGWGVMAAHGQGLRTIREPTQRRGERDARFVAGLLTAAMRSSTYRRSGGYWRGYAEAERHYGERLKRIERLLRVAESAALGTLALLEERSA